MVKPVIKGVIFTSCSEKASFKNRTTKEEESYMKHSVDLICTEPQKGVCTIKVYSDRDVLPFVEGKTYQVELSSFTLEKGTPVIVAQESGFHLVK